MADRLSPEQRSRNMSRVRNRDTAPEKIVRKALFAAGFRYRLHLKNLPGCPDIVLRRYRVAIFVHGCFWHGHTCRRGRRPTSNAMFWSEKIDRNIARDQVTIAAIKSEGWKAQIIWQCDLEHGTGRLIRLLQRLARWAPPPLKAVSRYSAKNRARRGGTALPIMRATGSI